MMKVKGGGDVYAARLSWFLVRCAKENRMKSEEKTAIPLGGDGGRGHVLYVFNGHA